MIELLWMYGVTDQRLRLRTAGEGDSWVEVWRDDELQSLCFARDLHPARFPAEPDSAVHQWDTELLGDEPAVNDSPTW